MGQHRSFSKDIDLLAEAYSAVGGTHFMHGVGVADQAAEHMAAEDGEEHDKTGHDSDHEILRKAEDAHTAGRELLTKGHDELEEHDSLSDETRTALARDVYAKWAQDDDPHAKDHHDEDAEATTPIKDPAGDTDEVDQAHFKKYQGQIDPPAVRSGWNQGKVGRK
tara:strand:- start:226 stop:720 length:495 start_codon:yes stop_codon:yes gene_type:complete